MGCAPLTRKIIPNKKVKKLNESKNIQKGKDKYNINVEESLSDENIKNIVNRDPKQLTVIPRMEEHRVEINERKK